MLERKLPPCSPGGYEDQVSFTGQSLFLILVPCPNLSLTLMFIFVADGFSFLAANMASIRGRGLKVGGSETSLSLKPGSGYISRSNGAFSKNLSTLLLYCLIEEGTLVA